VGPDNIVDVDVDVDVDIDIDIDIDIETLKDVRVIISMMVMCNDIVVIEYDGKRPGLPDAPVVMEHDNNRTEI